MTDNIDEYSTIAKEDLETNCKVKSIFKIKKLIFALGIASIAGCFLYFRFVVPYHVAFKEQIQLFVYNFSYISSYFSKPAAFACLAGDFLTQFLYFKVGGAVVIILLLVTEWYLIFLILKRFSVKRYALLWSLLPVIIEWISLPALLFSLALSVSLIIALSGFILYLFLIESFYPFIAKPLSRSLYREAFIIILIPVLYVIAGASVFLFVILAILYEIHRNKKNQLSILNSQLSILLPLSLILPFLLRFFYLLPLKQAYFYPFPDIAHMLSPVSLLLIVLFFVCFESQRGQKSGSLYAIITPILLIIILIAGLVKMTDKKWENIFGVSIEAYYKNWDKVLDIAEKAQLESPIATYYTNIALSKKSLLGDRLMDFYQPFTAGLMIPITSGSGWFTFFSSSDAYYHIGDMNMAQLAAMVGMISSPNQRSARMAEQLIEVNIANGDKDVAAKYMRMLESTLFHKIKPEMLENIPRQGIFKEDMIRHESDIKASLELLTEGDPDNLPALNYLLCYYLLSKDIPSFIKAYISYCKGKYTPVPKVYAEALLIYLAMTKSPVEEVVSYGIHPETIKAFSEYTRLYEQSNGQLAPMQKKFPNTYWLFYHFAANANN